MCCRYICTLLEGKVLPGEVARGRGHGSRDARRDYWRETAGEWRAGRAGVKGPKK